MPEFTATDTIAAIATAPGPAGISVVRVSGSGSLAVADRLFIGTPAGNAVRPSLRPGGSFVHGYVRQVEPVPKDPLPKDPGEGRSGEPTSRSGPAGREDVPADEVVLLIYRAPHSYTREDAIEIQTHGGRLPAQRVLRQVLACGVRLAEPGEFTCRAFLNGRIDLTQAEAVMDLIASESDRAASAAIMQIRGDVRSSLSTIYDLSRSSLADVEASLDFPEDEIPASVLTGAATRIARAREEATRLIGTWSEGRILREGSRVVIAGRPNVGKSTLLNAILNVERAIVSDLPGTTRDTIEETMIVAGFPVHIVDTAGLRDAECSVERHGVRRTLEMIAVCDIVLYVVDASIPLGEDDRSRMGELRRMRPAASAGESGPGAERAVLVVLNKTDLGQVVQAGDVGGLPCVVCSLVQPNGVRPVTQALEGMLASIADGAPHAAISERHYRGLRIALEHLGAAGDLLGTGAEDGPLGTGAEDGPALAAVHLRSGLAELGRLLGTDYTDDLLDEVFSRFCIGK